MTTAATSLLGLALPVTGELSGTWGDTVNNSITSLLDSAVAGTTTLSTDADVTLTTTTLAANQARQAILLCSGSRTGIKTITAPAQSKIYTIINATTGGYAVKLVGVGPTTGLTIPNGASAVVAWNGSDFIEIGSSTVGNLTVNGNLSVTGTTTLTGAATLTANPTLSAGTANGVAYLNGSKVVTTGSALTFDGTTLTANTANNTEVYVGAGSGTPILTLYGTASATPLVGYRGSGGLRFGTITGGGAAGFSEQMRLDGSTGNLGIGTSSPSQLLQVRKDQAAYTWARIDNQTNSASAYAGLAIGANGNTWGITIGSSAANSNALSFVLDATGTNSEKMRLDSSGNLGLGVTPSAVASSDRVLQVRNFLFDDNSNGYGILRYNNYYNGTNDVYLNTGTVSAFQMAGNAFRWYQAASGTAGNAITFTQAMTLDASGNLSVGTTSVVTAGSGYQAYTINGVNGSNIALNGGGSNIGLIYAATGNSNLYIGNQTAGGAVIFNAGSGSERARIDSSGNLLVGTTSVSSNEGFRIIKEAAYGGWYTDANHPTGVPNAYPYSWFRYNGTIIGEITQSGTTAVAYNTTSDYRLKENIQPLSGALARIAALKPCTYTWKSAPDEIGEGFIAHELAEVCPHAVTGEKDAVESYTDEEGNEQTRPVYQGIDTSFLVATLTAAIQELKAEFDAYKATHP